MFGKLYVVSTPIGNLGDITLRAIEILKSVNTVLCEDTRVTAKLISLLKTKNLLPIAYRPLLVSYHQHSGDLRKLEILKMLVEGKDLALVTDAGTPGVSDPGNELIYYLIERESKIQIITVPGASSLTAILSISGMNLSQFVFAGFLPKKGRSKFFTRMKETGLPIVFFDSPKRIEKTVNDLTNYFSLSSRIVIARELTKLHESVFRGTLQEAVAFMEKEDKRGEVVCVLGL